MYTESALRFGLSPMVFGDRICCCHNASATRFPGPQQIFHSKDYQRGPSLRKRDGQNLAIACVNAANGAAETRSGSSSTSTRDLPAAIYTTGLGVQYALAKNLADAPVSGGLVTENEERMGELKALAKLAAVRQGRILENKVFRQTCVIRSYEVGADGTTNIDTLISLFQEVSLNHVSLLGIAGDGFGATVGMNRYHLIWVLTRLHVEVDRFPGWPEIVEIDSWMDGAGKNGLRRDWLVREEGTGAVIARATSTWAMMNQDTRRLSKMPEDLRIETAPTFFKRCATEEAPKKIPKLDDTAKNIQSNLVPCRTDLDGNRHVNNITYIRWVMESVPNETLENRQLSSLTLEFRRECHKGDIVQSLTDLARETSMPVDENSIPPINNGTNILSQAEDKVTMADCHPAVKYTHLLRMQLKGEDAVRGRSVWKPKSQGHYKLN